MAETLRKMPVQKRARATFEAIVEAAARILEADGLDALNTNLVAARAGVSIGSLYQYFPNREAILTELVRREREILADAVSQIADGRVLSWQQALDGLIAAATAHQLNRPRLARTLEYVEHMVLPKGETDEFNRQIIKQVDTVLTRHGRRAGKHVAGDIVAMVRGMADAAGVGGESDPRHLATRLRLAVEGYLSRAALF